VFTNLTHDHLARRRTMRSYGQLKRRLFVRRGAAEPLALIDTADDFGKTIEDESRAPGGESSERGPNPVTDYRVRSSRWYLRSAEIRFT
jgi:UDP-N-acetylmuramoylalanine-D-glutamate ligase